MLDRQMVSTTIPGHLKLLKKRLPPAVWTTNITKTILVKPLKRSKISIRILKYLRMLIVTIPTIRTSKQTLAILPETVAGVMPQKTSPSISSIMAGTTGAGVLVGASDGAGAGASAGIIGGVLAGAGAAGTDPVGVGAPDGAAGTDPVGDIPDGAAGMAAVMAILIMPVEEVVWLMAEQQEGLEV
jgi:hypothetical protein